MSQRKSSRAAGLAVRCWPGDSVSLTETLQSPLHSVQSQLHPALTVHLPSHCPASLTWALSEEEEGVRQQILY